MLILMSAAVLPVGWAGFSADPAGKAAGPAASQLAATQPAATQPADVPAVWKEMFADGLIDADGNAAGLARLNGKIVGIYFSAHWSAPCRTFTAELVEFRDKNAGDLEIVFISSDRTKEEHRKYMTEARMKWLAVEWRTAPAAAVQKKFEVRVIPSLVILGPDGNEITRQGREDVAGDADNALAKWKKEAGLPAATQPSK